METLAACRGGTEIIGAISPQETALVYDPDPALTALDADRNWVRLVGEEVKQTLQRNTEGHRAQLKEKADRIAELEQHCDELTKRLRESTVLSGPIGRTIKSLWNRNPKVASAIRKLTGRGRPT